MFLFTIILYSLNITFHKYYYIGYHTCEVVNLLLMEGIHIGRLTCLTCLIILLKSLTLYIPNEHANTSVL